MYCLQNLWKSDTFSVFEATLVGSFLNTSRSLGNTQARNGLHYVLHNLISRSSQDFVKLIFVLLSDKTATGFHYIL